ncbi:MAG: hypothetical protein AB7R89_19030 [Dehalococcoidia bacterium]
MRSGILGFVIGAVAAAALFYGLERGPAQGQGPDVAQLEQRVAVLEARLSPPGALSPTAYADAFNRLMTDIDQTNAATLRDAAGTDPVGAIQRAAASYAAYFERARELRPPACYAEAHRALLYAMTGYEYDDGDMGTAFLKEAQRVFAGATC